jgi:hypothetical protein
MHRARVAVAATFVVTSLCAGSLSAQTTAPPPQTTPSPAQTAKAPPMTSVLAGRKFVAPVRGEALVEFSAPQTRRVKDMVVTRIIVRNASTAPIPRLTIDETWYDKGTAVLTGGKGVLPGLLQVGEVQVVVIETPFKVGMTSNNYTFSHANGTVKPQRVDKLELPKPVPAAAAAAAPAPR